MIDMDKPLRDAAEVKLDKFPLTAYTSKQLLAEVKRRYGTMPEMVRDDITEFCDFFYGHEYELGEIDAHLSDEIHGSDEDGEHGKAPF